MIKFGENNKVENIGILTEGEAKAYIHFLLVERCRHEDEIEDAETCVRIETGVSSMASIGEIEAEFGSSEAMKVFWKSAIRRHEEDIKAIDVLVTTLKGFYGI